MRLRITSITGILVFLSLLLFAQEAQAYPQFQFSTDNVRCSQCHFNPTGGGLVNAWGREEAADTISRGGGDADFFNGLFGTPEWLSLGGDFRAVGGARFNEANGPDTLLFPMQADLYTRSAFGDFRFNLTLGVRGRARNNESPPHSRAVSREHYLMWQPKVTGPYVRAGRFYAPYGLRQVDHTNYIRRDLGFYAIEETYGVSGGYLHDDDWELHMSAFTRDPVLKVGPAGSGFSVLFEQRFREFKASWGLQSKVQLGSESADYWGGGVLKFWLDSIDVLVLSELDIGVGTVDTPNADPIFKGIAHLNVTHFLTKGLLLGTTLEAKQADFQLSGKDAESATLSLQYFPLAHYELVLFAKAERTRETSDLVSFFMFHYYL